MGNVSTPSRKTTTPVARTVTTVATPSKADSATGSTENEAQNTDSSALSVAFKSIASSLYRAVETDEPHEYFGDSDRLLRLAANLADNTGDGTPMTASEATSAAFDIAALVIASRRVPGDSNSGLRQSHVAQAKAVLAALTDSEDVLQEQLPTRLSPLRDNAPAQAALVFERIASMADSACDVLRSCEDPHGGALIVEYIGALADSMHNCTVIGNTADWACGPNYRTVVQA